MILTLLAFIASVHAASTLDRPIEAARPTVRSEIRRGVDAGGDCTGSGPDFDQCITVVESRNVQQNRASDPFLVGLYFTSWLSLNGYETVTRNVTGSATPTSASRFWRKMSEVQRRVGIDDASTCEAANVNCRSVLPDMATWRARQQ